MLGFSVASESERVVTVSEAAGILGVSEPRVRALLLKGRIVGARKFGHMWAIPLNSKGKPDIIPRPAGRPKRTPH